MEIKLNPGENQNKRFERISKINNEHDDDTWSLDKENLIAIVMNATTASHVSITTEMRLKGDRTTITT